MVVGLSERVDSSLGTALTNRSNTSGPVSGDRLNLIREHDLVRKGIERSEKLIILLISTRIPSDYVDIALIRKCNTIDLPALQSASKTCEISLLKYLSFLILIVIKFLLYWIVLNLGRCILFRHTQVLRCTLSRHLLEILLTLVFSLIMLIKRSLYFLKLLN